MFSKVIYPLYEMKFENKAYVLKRLLYMIQHMN